MQNNEIEIAVRVYENQKFGSTFGKGKYHKAIFNAAADVLEPSVKYLLDFYNWEDWSQTAQRDDMNEMECTSVVAGIATSNTLASWVVRYDTKSKRKTSVPGFCTLDTRTGDVRLVVVDEDAGVHTKWDLVAKPCNIVEGKKSPTLLATNTDLSRR